MPRQLKRVFLNLQTKAEILDLLQSGTSPSVLCKKYGVAKSTISLIKTKERKIFERIDSEKRKTLKISVYPKMEEALYEWYLKQKEEDLPVTGNMMTEKAKALFENFYTGTFHASNGWLHKFKHRFGIKLLRNPRKGLMLCNRKQLSLKEKGEILHLLQKGTAGSVLSRKYRVSESTISEIKNKRHEIFESIHRRLGRRKSLKLSMCPKMETALYVWYLEQQEDNALVTDNMIKEKAKTLFVKFYTGPFQASDCWLQNFKERYCIKFLKIAENNPPELIPSFKEKVLEKITELQLSSEQIYYADESGLHFKPLNDETEVSSSKATPGIRKAEKRGVTYLTCTNATGNHKVKLLVVAQSKNHQEFQDCLFHHNYSKPACMTTNTFENCFKNNFIPEVKEFLESRGLPVRALLLLNNVIKYPSVEELNKIDDCITVMYMPPNATPLFEHTHQNACSENNASMKDTVANLNSAWGKIKPTEIKNCWSNILPQTDAFNSRNQDLHTDIEVVWIEDCKLENQQDENTLEIQHEDNEVAAMLISSDEEDLDTDQSSINSITPNSCNWNDVEVVWNVDCTLENQQDEDTLEIKTEDNEVTAKLVSSDEALTSLDNVIQWVAENFEEVEYSNMVVLQNLRDKLIEKLNVLT